MLLSMYSGVLSLSSVLLVRNHISHVILASVTCLVVHYVCCSLPFCLHMSACQSICLRLCLTICVVPCMCVCVCVCVHLPLSTSQYTASCRMISNRSRPVSPIEDSDKQRKIFPSTVEAKGCTCEFVLQGFELEAPVLLLSVHFGCLPCTL